MNWNAVKHVALFWLVLVILLLASAGLGFLASKFSFWGPFVAISLLIFGFISIDIYNNFKIEE